MKLFGCSVALVAALAGIFGASTASATQLYSLTTLVNFNGANGANPQGNLIADANGSLFGTTEDGGANPGGVNGTGRRNGF